MRVKEGVIKRCEIFFQSINILFYVCSHRGDIRQKQKHIIIVYINFPTGL